MLVRRLAIPIDRLEFVRRDHGPVGIGVREVDLGLHIALNSGLLQPIEALFGIRVNADTQKQAMPQFTLRLRVAVFGGRGQISDCLPPQFRSGGAGIGPTGLGEQRQAQRDGARQRVEIVSTLGQAGNRLRSQVGSKRHDDRVACDVLPADTHRSRGYVYRINRADPDLDAAVRQFCQRPLNLVRRARTGRNPEE